MKEFITEWTVVDSQANATATATKAAPTAPQRHYITMASVSFSGTPATALTLLVRENATTTKWRVEIPAATTSPVMLNFVKPIRCTEAVSCDVTIAAAGSGITATVSLGGYTASC